LGPFRRALLEGTAKAKSQFPLGPKLTAARYNTAVPELSFFIGKGGVGKTTVSSAYAVYRAHQRRKVLLLSTDPAHSLADIFQIRLGSKTKRLRVGSGHLDLWQIDAQQRFQRFLKKYRASIFTLLESGTIFTRKEIEPLLSTALPGMAEVSALLAVADLLDTRRYDELVVDTAPLGHTLRLFQMPEHFLRFLDFLNIAGSRDQVLAAHFGGRATLNHGFLAEWRQIVARVHEALSEKNAKLVLVTTPESFSLNESARAAETLAEDDRLRINEIVLNRAVVDAGKHGCKSCRARSAAVRSATVFLGGAFPGVPIRLGQDQGSPVLGAKDLRAFGEHIFRGRKLRLTMPAPVIRREPQFRAIPWPVLPTPLSLTLGKGGVGKTTISAGLAFHHRRAKPRHTVTVCSTDPAPSLDDVFKSDVESKPAPVLGDPKLQALEIDSVAEFRGWAEEMRTKIDSALSSNQRGVHIDFSFDRRLFRALLDIVPPGVDELFAVFKILDLLESGSSQGSRVLIDMAPTGHALELLRMPDRMLLWSRLLLRALAEHRELPLAQEVAVEIARISQRVRSLAAMLKDGRRSQLWPVMLAEPLPDRQTERLLAAIKGLGGHASPLFVNRVLLGEEAKNCPRCRVARQWQMATINRLAARKRPFYLVRNFAREIAGAAALQSFTRQLWQLE
jgi:arsenite/tail-anchored protein-transporting ATPase